MGRGRGRLTGPSGEVLTAPKLVLRVEPSMIIACAPDRAYVQLSSVMLQSVAACGEVPEAEFVVFGYRLSRGDMAKMKASVPGRKVRFIDTSRALRQVSGIPRGHWPLSTFSRIFAPELLAPSEDRMLYLDGDIVVNGSLRDLLTVPMNGCSIAAVPGGRGQNERLGLGDDYVDFNAGVLLVDLAEWRKQDVTKRIIEWVRQNSLTLKYPDNDALIALCGNQFAYLQDYYNYTGHGGRRWSVSLDKMRIIHFTGTRKPDFSDCTHPAKPIFMRHRQNTAWKDQPLLAPSVRRRRMLAERVLNRLNLIRQRYLTLPRSA